MGYHVGISACNHNVNRDLHPIAMARRGNHDASLRFEEQAMEDLPLDARQNADQKPRANIGLSVGDAVSRSLDGPHLTYGARSNREGVGEPEADRTQVELPRRNAK